MKGIMFKQELFRAVVAGKKTQTRRIVSPQPDDRGLRFTDRFEDWHGREVKPRYLLGELVYLKEPYFIVDGKGSYLYDTARSEGFTVVWKNKMFMPASAARYFIRITNVKCERLNDITGEDALQEGVKVESTWPVAIGDAYRAYQKLWESINGPGSWNLNPWVWVYEFELTQKP